jgi:long-chain acyl-CoA synthetase|tara:strand:- start:1405 stop:2901 length:1497 start_codon:yes stop_codon:yes gene_type:complete
MHRTGTAFIYGSETISWSEFGQQIASVAGALREAGIQPGDRVAVLAGNSPAHVIAMYAILWSGAVLVPLNIRLAPHEMERILTESGTRAMFSDAANKAAAKEMSDLLPLVTIALDAGAVGAHSWAEVTSHEPIEAARTDISSLAAIYYTGGTTGAPKGVMLNHGSLTFQALNLVRELDIRRESIAQAAPPLFHLAGAGFAQACTMAGATQIFLTEFDPVGVLESIRKHRATHVSLVPTMLGAVMDIPSAGADMATIQRVIYGASSISDTLLRKVIAICPHVGLTQIYGQTECTGPCLFLPPEDHALEGKPPMRLASAGRPDSCSDVRLVDANDNPVDVGTAGEIVIRGPSVMMGYWQNESATNDALRGGWLHTGDVGIEDEEGYIRVVDRIKDMIVTGGENVFCAEVENVIATLPGVKFCSVIGVPDEKWGERVHAVVGVGPDTDVTAEAVIAHCKTEIAGYKCPKTVELTATPLPLSAVGKVRKDLLRAQYIEKTKG